MENNIYEDGSVSENNMDLILFDIKYYYINHRISHVGSDVYKSHDIREYDTWRDCITKIPYNILKKLYKENSYDIIPENGVNRINHLESVFY